MSGYRVLEASSPEEATYIASNRGTEIDLLLTDVVMLGMSGPELTRRISEVRPGLVTLFMTGYAECEVARAVHGTTQHHIQKPFTVDSLLSRGWPERWPCGGSPATVTDLLSTPPPSPSSAVAPARPIMNGMARGWESKSVEAQIEESISAKPAEAGPPLTGEQVQEHIRKTNLLLSRRQVLQQLEQSTNERYTDLLRRTLADLDEQLAAL